MNCLAQFTVGFGWTFTSAMSGLCCIGHSLAGLANSPKGYGVGAVYTCPALALGQEACTGIDAVDTG